MPPLRFDGLEGEDCLCACSYCSLLPAPDGRRPAASISCCHDFLTMRDCTPNCEPEPALPYLSSFGRVFYHSRRIPKTAGVISVPVYNYYTSVKKPCSQGRVQYHSPLCGTKSFWRRKATSAVLGSRIELCLFLLAGFKGTQMLEMC